MGLYLKVVLLVFVLVASVGFAGPYLISSSSDELVLMGFGLLVLVVVPIVFVLGKSCFVDIKKLIEKGSK